MRISHPLALALLLASDAFISSLHAQVPAIVQPLQPSVPIIPNLSGSTNDRSGDPTRTLFQQLQGGVNAIIGARGAPNGLAGLDVNGMVPYVQLPPTNVQVTGGSPASLKFTQGPSFPSLMRTINNGNQTPVMAFGSNRGDSVLGLQIGGGNPEDGTFGNVLRAEGHATWSGFFPSRDTSSAELAVHTTAATGEAVSVSGTNQLTWAGRGHAFDAAWIGRRIWFNKNVYRVATVNGNRLTVTNIDGSTVVFPSTVSEVYFYFNVHGEATCIISGTTVTRVSGDPFIPYYFDPSFEFRIDGVIHRVAGFANSKTYTLSSAPGDKTNANCQFWADINNGQITTFRLHRSYDDVENLSLYTRPDGNWMASQYGAYGKYRPIHISTGELSYAPGSPVSQINAYPEATVLGGDYGWDTLRVLTPQTQPSNYMFMQSGSVGAAPTLGVGGSDINVGLKLLGKGSSGVLSGIYYRPNDPTGTDIPAGLCADWNNTTNNTLKRVCNLGTQLKSIAYQ